MRYAILILLMCLNNAAGAEDETDYSGQPLDCMKPVDAGRSAIKNTLGPLYANGADLPQLKVAAYQIRKLVTDATFCRVALQSGEQKAPRDTVIEWTSLHQWLGRLAGTLEASMQNSGSDVWRDEYLLFAEIYDFEP